MNRPYEDSRRRANELKKRILSCRKASFLNLISGEELTPRHKNTVFGHLDGIDFKIKAEVDHLPLEPYFLDVRIYMAADERNNLSEAGVEKIVVACTKNLRSLKKTGYGGCVESMRLHKKGGLIAPKVVIMVHLWTREERKK